MSQQMSDWISFYKFLMFIRWLEKSFKRILRSLIASEIGKNILTGSELQGTISAMKGGGV